MVTIKDVAQVAQVSKSTVSRVVSRNGNVSPEAKVRVLEAIETLGYRPNTLAQGLKNKRSDVIGVVVTNISSPYFADLLGGIERVIRKSGMNLVVCSGYGSFIQEKTAVESLIARRCDALILYLQSDITEGTYWENIRTQVPMVMMGTPVGELPDYGLMIDNEEGGYLATKHFIDLGHQHIMHLAGAAKMMDSKERISGFQRAMEEAGLPHENNILQDLFSDSFGFEGTEEILRKHPKCTAIFAGDDEIAAGVLLALRKNNIRVPEDMSVIGFDDTFHARHLYPPLSTIRQPIDAFGEAASGLIIDRLAKTVPEETKLVFKPELIIRESAGPAPKR